MQKNILIVSDGSALETILHGKIEQPCIRKIHGGPYVFGAEK